jgi:hypothetical protein
MYKFFATNIFEMGMVKVYVNVLKFKLSSVLFVTPETKCEPWKLDYKNVWRDEPIHWLKKSIKDPH